MIFVHILLIAMLSYVTYKYFKTPNPRVGEVFIITDMLCKDSILCRVISVENGRVKVESLATKEIKVYDLILFKLIGLLW